MPEIQRVSHRHDAIIDWLIANPDKPLKQCAADLGYTQAWLSIIIHSDAFRAEYEERREAITHPELRSLHEKLTELAHYSVDKLTDRVRDGAVDDPRILADVTDKALNKLGYGVQKGGPGGGAQVNVQNNYYTAPVDRASLAQARSRMHQLFPKPAGEAEEDNSAPALEHEPSEPSVGRAGTTPASEAHPREPTGTTSPSRRRNEPDLDDILGISGGNQAYEPDPSGAGG